MKGDDYSTHGQKLSPTGYKYKKKRQMLTKSSKVLRRTE